MISKDQTDSNRYRNSVFFVSAARVGLRHLLQNLHVDKNKFILLPSYIGYSYREGSGVLDPIEECGLNYAFYKVNDDLSADLEDLWDKMSLHKTFAIVIIHYFGIVQSDIIAIKNICSKRGIYVVEDCAHCLKSSYKGIPLGDFGDFSIFSIHKILPTLGGGILKVNRRDISLPLVEDTDKIAFQALEIYSSSQHDNISSIRTVNYKLLVRLLSDVVGIRILYPELDEGIVPMNLPILIESKSRHSLYQALLNEGVETMALYYELVDSIKESEFPYSYEISRKILNLPIHQDLSEKDIYSIANKLCKILAKTNL